MKMMEPDWTMAEARTSFLAASAWDVYSVWLEESHRKQDPVMLVLFIEYRGGSQGDAIVTGALKRMHDNEKGQRVADEMDRGWLRISLDIQGDVQGCDVAFIAPHCNQRLFWRAVALLLRKLKDKLGIETELLYRHETWDEKKGFGMVWYSSGRVHSSKILAGLSVRWPFSCDVEEEIQARMAEME